MKTYYLKTYGCTLNQSDSFIIEALMRKEKFKRIESEKNAALIILNTCTVKASTETKILYRIRQVAKLKKPLIVAGCLSVNEEAIRKNCPYCTIVMPHALASLPSAISSALAKKAESFIAPSNKALLPRIHSGAIAKIPIAEGCLSNCSFCQTKLARPHFFSYSSDFICREVSAAVSAGAKEIQLTAQDTGAWGRERKEELPSLLRRLCKLPGNFFIRIGMINPEHAMKMQKGLISTLKNKKMYKFLHIPVQSGNDRILRLMKRNYSVQEFEKSVNSFRKAVPSITIATDIIAGFPTESDSEFSDTVSLIKRLRPDVVNVSRFCPRPGTPAKKMKQLSSQVLKERTRQLSEICRQIAKENNEKLIGKTLSVLITEKQKTLTGRTTAYCQAALPKNSRARIGSSVKAKITAATHSCLLSV
ncbi:threonylcarbamoyladenosine tRNA methylthiotransferase [Candidatus Micrarchaeota archaeon CG11_big_fil_rev_8_21_14_0_20_47_5]|nr:MAG: hypothetical protein AUJ17_04810 [Candidatus Micrarchaeota archaeon CG1_02_47_40]PIN83787.1 MAG: threonylcarbamoyladenosine tRNA methylthiotransferase [Candidatus Micrarchaeota archaeon CG11_big_fil_rev_8_21_14_0_20_47_5]